MSRPVILRRTGGLGDILMMTPGLRAFSEENGKLNILLPEGFKGVLDNLDYLENIIYLNSEVDPLVKKAELGWNGQLSDLSDYEFDYEHHMQPNVMKTKIELFAEKLGVNINSTRLDISLTDQELSNARDYLNDNGINPEKLVLFGVSSAQPLRSWPLKNWKKVIDKAVEWGYDVLVVDKELNWDDERLTFFNNKSIRELYAISSYAKLSMSNDSSLLHISSGAFHKPNISIFGPTDPKFRAIYPESFAVDLNFPCRCWYSRCETVDCLKEVTPQLVNEKMMEVLQYES